MGIYTVRLEDVYGRVILDRVDSDSGAHAASAAVASAPGYTSLQVIDQSQVLKPSGTDANGNPLPVQSLPLVPTV